MHFPDIFGPMTELLFSDPEKLKALGFDLLVAGLIGNILVLFIPSRKALLGKGLGAFFILMIIAGVIVERIGETKLAEPRHLTDEQVQRVIAKVKRYAGLPFDLAVNPEHESIALMGQLETILKDAGWIGKSRAGGGFGGPGELHAGLTPAVGLRIQIDMTQVSQWGGAVAALQDALRAEGLPATALVIPDHIETADAIHIYVGTKR